jgi:putative glutathione S-transferase
VLAERRYLCGPTLTEADVCMFTTLIRFDPVYFLHFKCNRRRIVDYEHLSAYLRELYQLPHVAGVCDFDHIKQHYYRSHPALNPKGIVPSGPDLGWLLQPHGRQRWPGGPPPELLQAA